jgi:hypothetical protein
LPDSTYLRPTAACFRSDRHIRNADARIPTNASNIEPGYYEQRGIPARHITSRTEISESVAAANANSKKCTPVEGIIRRLVVGNEKLRKPGVNTATLDSGSAARALENGGTGDQATYIADWQR